jgi:hypothetical protein
MLKFLDNVTPFKPARAIAWIEASRRSYNANNPYGEILDFKSTVEMLEDSACSELEDWRALKALEIMKDGGMTAQTMNSLGALADARTVAKIQQKYFG